MWSKISSRGIFSLFVLVGFSFSLGFISQTFVYSILNGSGQNGLSWLTANIIAPYNQSKINSGIPTHLTIPKMEVDAIIDQVGLAADWSMAAPKYPANAAWFNLGPHPGDNGSAVIAGHYGWKNGIPAVFDNLHKLIKGDRLYVNDGKGATTTFVVREFRTYGQNEDATEVFSSSDGKAHLNLITCEGIWDKVSKSYSKRLVVFTDKVVE